MYAASGTPSSLWEATTIKIALGLAEFQQLVRGHPVVVPVFLLGEGEEMVEVILADIGFYTMLTTIAVALAERDKKHD